MIFGSYTMYWKVTKQIKENFFANSKVYDFFFKIRQKIFAKKYSTVKILWAKVSLLAVPRDDRAWKHVREGYEQVTSMLWARLRRPIVSQASTRPTEKGLFGESGQSTTQMQDINNLV